MLKQFLLLQKLLGHMAQTPTLLVLGGVDGCMPNALDLGKRMQQALGSKADFAYIPEGVHDLSGSEEEFMAAVDPFVKQCFGLASSSSTSSGHKPFVLHSGREKPLLV